MHIGHSCSQQLTIEATAIEAIVAIEAIASIKTGSIEQTNLLDGNKQQTSWKDRLQWQSEILYYYNAPDKRYKYIHCEI